MTVDTELTKLNFAVRQHRGGQIFLPEWTRKDLVNLHVPSEADLYTQAITQAYPVGTQVKKSGGLFRYFKAGATMTANGFLKGNYFQVPGKAGNSANSGFEGAFYAAVAAGDTSFSIADTAAAKNEYEGALLVIYNDTTVRYDNYRILGNDATDATSTKLYIAPPGFKTLASTSIGITIYRNEYMGIRQVTGGYMSALGIAQMSVTSAYWAWMQTAGRVSGITGASTWPGQTQYYRDVYCNTDGSLIGYTAGYQRVGFLLHRTASDYGDNTIMMQLDV